MYLAITDKSIEKKKNWECNAVGEMDSFTVDVEDNKDGRDVAIGTICFNLLSSLGRWPSLPVHSSFNFHRLLPNSRPSAFATAAIYTNHCPSRRALAAPSRFPCTYFFEISRRDMIRLCE